MNVGPATEKDLNSLGITRPAQLVGKDPVKLYERLCRVTGVRHDPCCLDVFMAAVDQASGKKPRPWWEYTPLRKRLASNLSTRR